MCACARGLITRHSLNCKINKKEQFTGRYKSLQGVWFEAQLSSIRVSSETKALRNFGVLTSLMLNTSLCDAFSGIFSWMDQHLPLDRLKGKVE